MLVYSIAKGGNVMRNVYKYISGFFLVLITFFIVPEVNAGNQASSDKADVVVIHDDAYGEQLGTVYFPVSCNEAASRYVKRGLALMHHMTYEGARSAFAAATEIDPDCAMGYWGQAMTFIHPLWSDPPGEEDFKRGQMLVNEAGSRGEKGEWERAYISAVEAYYAAGRTGNEKINLASYEKAWEKVYQKFPKDMEAASFYALAHMATADPDDKTYVKQRRAGEIVEGVIAQVPDHPGAHHYIVHAYDYPELSEKALAVARSYGTIAPDVPHALHMPTHIFTRLGYWQESIEMNKKSAAAALKHPVNGAVSLHYIHALDYLAYAYLQQGDDQNAEQVQYTLKTLRGPYQIHIATSYPFAAVPARVSLERPEWIDAAALKPRTPGNYPWDKFPAMEAITYFAQALGAARSGNEEVAAEALESMAALHKKTAERSSYWAKQVEIQRLSALAWLTYRKGNKDEALEIMQRAAQLEASTEKHPVTPGEILPARELLADMLLEMGRYREALGEYKVALERSANRFNSLYGAGRAAQLMGNKKEAVFYYRKLVELSANDSKRERLQQARTFLAEN
jgi:tetratricopeptide (TPR) repeat protein